jgi:glycosyltransferase involved in cell wall biosynthesis
VLEILKHSEAFVLPSLVEGLPAVILEAMYCKTPVIANDVGGIGEVVISRRTGWLIKKGDEEDFEKSLIEVLQKGQDNLMEIANAKRMISEKFLNDKIARRFYAAYQKSL